MGMIENKLRLPLVPTRITTFEAIRKVLNELNINANFTSQTFPINMWKCLGKLHLDTTKKRDT
jgi:hypothetical protein